MALILFLVFLSVFLASLPMIFLLVLVWWLDRYEREPIWLVVLVFAWGAIGGVLLGIDKYTTVLIAGTITVIYSAMSGLWGVVVTDLLLFAIAMIGSIAAAYYAVAQPEVGGLAGLISHPALEGKLSLLPDFTDWRVALPVFIIPIAVQWWSVWCVPKETNARGRNTRPARKPVPN